MGKLIKDNELMFGWSYDDYERPYLYSHKTKTIIYLTVEQDVPILDLTSIQSETVKMNQIPDSAGIAFGKYGGQGEDHTAFPIRRRLREKQPASDIYPEVSPSEKNERYMQYVRGLTHRYGCNCKFCRIAKQRRHKSNRIPLYKRDVASVVGKTTMTDTYEINDRERNLGVEGSRYGQVFLDDASGGSFFFSDGQQRYCQYQSSNLTVLGGS